MDSKRCFSILCTAIFAFWSETPASANPVTGWGLETEFAAGLLTEGSAGSFSVSSVTGNAVPRALIRNPVDLSDIGDTVELSGTVTMADSPGNQQFRFGLFDTNGQAPGTLSGGLWSAADPYGWLGYMLHVGGGQFSVGDQDAVKARTTTGPWFSNTGAYIVGVGPGFTPSPPANTPYDFSLRLTRTGATSVQIGYSFVGGTVNRNGTFVDHNLGASVSATTYDAVGFLLNGETGDAVFSNVSVVVPEPTSTALLLTILPAFLFIGRQGWCSLVSSITERPLQET